MLFVLLLVVRLLCATYALAHIEKTHKRPHDMRAPLMRCKFVLLPLRPPEQWGGKIEHSNLHYPNKGTLTGISRRKDTTII